MQPNTLKSLLSENQNDFLVIAKDIPYELKGISNFEGLCLWSLTNHYRPQIIIESGVARGRSTNLLCLIAAQFGVEQIYAFDKSNDHEYYVRQKLGHFSNLTYEIGDSSDKIRRLANTAKSKKVLVFIDGPKSGEAYRDVMDAVSGFDNLTAIIGHDCYVNGPTRKAFEQAFLRRFRKYELFFTDSSFCKDKSVNSSIRNQVEQFMPEKLQFIDEKCYEIGIITKV